MLHRAITALAETLQPRIDLGKSRLETLCLLVVGMVSARTVNLGHIACERPGSVLIASTWRRLQRFSSTWRCRRTGPADPRRLDRIPRALDPRARPDPVGDRRTRDEFLALAVAGRVT